MQIILASSSKRRSSILTSCGISHRVIVSRVKEYTKGASGKSIVMKNAELKAEKVAGRLNSGFIIGADTVVLFEKRIIGKPRNEQHAKSMLRSMSGNTILVYTGLCVIDVNNNKKVLDFECSMVKVKKIDKNQLSKYFKLLGPYDKAGGFSIEGVGSFIFDDIKGSYFNVLGLPMGKLKECFTELGMDLLDAIRIKK